MGNNPFKIIAVMVVLTITGISSCVKNNTTVLPTIVIADSISYNQYQVATLTGRNITFKQSSYDGFIGGQLVKLCAYGNKLGFVVPELSAGGYTLQSTIEGNQCVITINIKALPAFTSADTVIQSVLAKTIPTSFYLDSIISLTDSMQGCDLTNDPSNVMALKNLDNQVNTSISGAVTSDKLYLAKIIAANPSLFGQLQGALYIIDTNRLYRKTSTSFEQKSDSIVSRVISYLSINSATILATKAIIAVPQQPALVAQFAEGAISCHLFDAMKAAVILFNEPLINTSLDIASYSRTTFTNFTVNNNQLYSFQLTGSFRNLCNTDSTSAEPLITGLYTALNTFGTAWNNLKTILPAPLAGNAFGFSNITATRPKVLAVNPSSLSVGALSNSNVVDIVSTTTGVLTIQFVSNQVNTSEAFSFTITYNNPNLSTVQQTFNGTVLAQRSGKIVAGGNGLGSGNNQLYTPSGLWIDASGKLYISDLGNNRVVKWDTGAAAITGTVIAGGMGVGTANNQLNNPAGIWMDASGNLFIADKGNNRIMEWVADSTTGKVVAGFPTSSDSMLSSPSSVYVTSTGVIYVADALNNRVQKWVPGVGVTTVAGGHGSGSAANQLNNPGGVFVDGSGNVYIADTYNNRVQKWAAGATSGVTVAGGNGTGSAGNQLITPAGLYVNSSGDVYIADKGNARIQKWVAGTNAGITAATGVCNGVCLDASGNIYVLNVSDVSKWQPL